MNKNWYSAMFFLVPVLNIILNTLTARVAKDTDSLWQAVSSSTFFLTILVGTASVTSLVLLYKSGVALPRGILLMGAMSILGGSLWGMYHTGLKFTATEWGLFASIAAFMAARLYQSFSG